MRSLVFLASLLPALAWAAPLQHQGRLLDPAGGPINGERTLGFTLTNEAGGTLWQGQYDVRLEDGYFSVILGDASNPLDELMLSDAAFITTSVDGIALGPPSPVHAVPRAEVSRAVQGGPVDASEVRIDGELAITGDGNVVAPISRTAMEGLGCSADQLPMRGPGGWGCVDISAFVPSGQSCPGGQVLRGVAADGTLNCVPDANTTYNGSDFAVSNQSCPSGQKLTGINASGNAICAADIDTNTTYSGSNFATSNQACASNQFVRGISSSGAIQCAALDSAINTYIRNHCWIHFGWRDSIDGGNSAPAKYLRVQASNGSGTPGCSSVGGDNDCLQYTLHGQSVRLAALNTDGTVNDDDKFYIGMYCVP